MDDFILFVYLHIQHTAAVMYQLELIFSLVLN